MLPGANIVNSNLEFEYAIKMPFVMKISVSCQKLLLSNPIWNFECALKLPNNENLNLFVMQYLDIKQF